VVQTARCTRAAINTSREPVSSWLISVGEDLFAVSLGVLTIGYSWLALAVAVSLFVGVVCFLGCCIPLRTTMAQWVPIWQYRSELMGAVSDLAYFRLGVS